jgi:glycosyltransferase involved in cell wall biosynthesis
MGGRVRNLAILTALAPRFDLEIVTLVHDRARLGDPGPVAGLGDWRPVLAWHRRGPLHRILGQAGYRAAGTKWGREAWFLASRTLAREVSAAIRERPPAIVHSAYWFTLRHLTDRPRPPLWVLDTHDVQFERFERAGAAVSDFERRAELDELSRADLVIAITPKDAETFRTAMGRAPRIETIGMGVDLAYWSRAALRAPEQRRSILYYGNMAAAGNRAAAVHLCTEILPLLRLRHPATEVVLLGANPASDVRRLESIPGVRVTGTVDDPRNELASGAVFALSLKGGSGIRSRVCEVMGLEVPVVAYPEALDGMDFEEGDHYLAARDPQGFADRIGQILDDPALGARIARSAREVVERRYSIPATYGRFVGLYEELLSRGPTAR